MTVRHEVCDGDRLLKDRDACLQNPEVGDLTEDWDGRGAVSVHNLDGVDLDADEDLDKDVDKEVCDTNGGSGSSFHGTSSLSWSCPNSSSSSDDEDDDVDNTVSRNNNTAKQPTRVCPKSPNTTPRADHHFEPQTKNCDRIRDAPPPVVAVGASCRQSSRFEKYFGGGGTGARCSIASFGKFNHNARTGTFHGCERVGIVVNYF